MLARLVVSAALVALTASDPACPRDGERVAAAARPSSAPLPRSIRLEGTGYELAFAAPGTRPAGPPSPALLRALSVWVAHNAALPPSDALPAVKLAPRTRIAALRHMGVPSDDPQLLAAIPPGQRETVAVYDDLTTTIYLPSDWSGSTPAEISIVVHEMVHHLQSVGRLRYACTEAREELAYAAQDKWLHLFGRSLAAEFDVDPFTRLAASLCGY